MKNKTEVVNLEKDRYYDIVKRNDLIQESRYNLTVQEQKIIVYIISKIKPEDIDLKEYNFNIKDFCQICGLDFDNGANYKYIRQTLKDLRDKSIWLKNKDGFEETVGWLDKVKMAKNNGTVIIKLDDLLKPYLLQLKKNFTSYSLYFTLAMKSKYSIRLYELLKSYQNLGQWEFTIEQLKTLLTAENYDIFANFKIKVLDIAMREINDYGDISVSYELEKQGRKFHRIKFTIAPKYLDGDESWETVKRIEKILNT